MKISTKGISLIKQFEGCKLQAYLCPAGIPTIGYGTTKGVKLGDEITQSKAEFLLLADLVSFEKEVNNLGLKLNQNQFDAVLSFCYNCGVGLFKNSSMYKLMKVNSTDKAIGVVWNRYVYAAKVVLPGLVKRRKAETDLYYS